MYMVIPYWGLSAHKNVKCYPTFDKETRERAENRITEVLKQHVHHPQLCSWLFDVGFRTETGLRGAAEAELTIMQEP